MNGLRLPLMALMTIAFVLPPTPGTAEEERAPKGLILPLTGTGGGGVTFNGTVAVQRFVQEDGQVFAIGAVSGSLSGPAGPIGTAVYLPVAFPVHVGDGLSARAGHGVIHPASLSASDNGARLILAQASTTCGVLHLDLGAVNLNLLGVVVATTPVTININGDTGGPLGNLVCATLATVNNVVGLVKLLNSVLGVVTGLLGGLTGGLGAAVPM
jgi:hypothetical protein